MLCFIFLLTCFFFLERERKVAWGGMSGEVGMSFRGDKGKLGPECTVQKKLKMESEKSEKHDLEHNRRVFWLFQYFFVL